MLHEVIPPELLRHCQRKSTGGEDYLRLPNGSTVYFAGLDDPERWFSSEIGGVGFDEAHQITEEAVVKLISRLRQRGMPGRVRLCFNPENPGHWLYRWFTSPMRRTSGPGFEAGVFRSRLADRGLRVRLREGDRQPVSARGVCRSEPGRDAGSVAQAVPGGRVAVCLRDCVLRRGGAQ
jgi:hypothetical protein